MKLRNAWLKKRKQFDGVRTVLIYSPIGTISNPVFLVKSLEVLPPESEHQQTSKTSSFERIYQKVKEELGL